MDTLFQQVGQAQRRLFLQQFLSNLMLCWFVALLAALVAIGMPKLWAMPFAGEAWDYGWLGGALVAGLAVAFGWTWFHRRDRLAAALEIDRRFGLKERVSSSLALAPEDLESEAGRALLSDALRRVNKLDVGGKFEVSLSRRAWLPLSICLAALALVFFVGDKLPESVAKANTPTQGIKKDDPVKQSTESLRKKIEEIRKEAKENGLSDAADLFKKIEEGIKELNNKSDVDRKQALVKLNDLAKQMEDRKQQLGGEEKIKQQLDQLKDLQKGPADKLAQALKNGDLQNAAQELDKLKQDLEQGKLDEQQKQDLANQLGQMQDKLQQMANAREQAKQDLQQQIQQQRAAGNTAAAGQLQQQLDKLQQSSKMDEQLQNMAGQLGQASQAMKDGNPSGAQQALDQLQQGLSQLQKQQSELKSLEGALDQLTQAKDQMNCKQCGGAGCEKCKGGKIDGEGGDGLGQGDGQPSGSKPGGQGQGGDGQPGDGQGLGRAAGATGQRPENANKTKLFDSKVNQNVRNGAAMMTDLVDGPNVKGHVLEQIKEQTEGAKKETSDPLTGQRLPKQHKEHAQQYFDALREGK